MLCSAWERILEFTRNDNAQLIMVVFPHCPEFYNYDTMSYIDGTIRSSYEFCSSLGGDDGHLVGLFHPRFENEPKMLSPEKHSPFPTFAIHSRNIIGDMEEQAPAEELFQADVKYEGDGELNYSSLRMKENVMELEKLFNSGASSAQNNVVGISMDSKDYVVDLTKDWIAKNSENGYNEALRYTETIEDRWIISNSDIGEEIFCDIWNTIHALHELAQKDIPEAITIVSSMFICPNFCTFNASRFKRFAIAVNGPLKKLSNDAIFLELFHNEYVAAKKKSHSNYRRSPMPSLQICGRMKK